MRRQAVLLGSPDTKRTEYFMQAARQEKLPVVFTAWKEFEQEKNVNRVKDVWLQKICQPQVLSFFKIDPPHWESSSLEELERLSFQYVKKLERLSELANVYPAEFLNHPSAIMQLLNKRMCKQRLKQAGLPVTEAVWDDFAAVCKERTQPKHLTAKGSVGQAVRQAEKPVEMLMEIMREKRVHQIFLKPVYGSGAAGVSAFRLQPASGRMVLYTCALLHPDYGFVNTKRLRRFSDAQEIVPLLDRLLRMDCIAERWYAKAEYQEYSYDLRAVVLDGRTDFLLARLSKGPVTNLHLNNRSLEIEKLELAESVLESVRDLCKKAAGCFAGLRSVGIDILLEKGSLNPRIIEMNAQGDLIYQDIFQKNRIYRRQAAVMKSWLKNG